MKKLLYTICAISFATSLFAQSGTLDNSFGKEGKVVTPVTGTLDKVNSLAVQQDGKIVVGGIQGSSKWNFLMVRYNPDGSLDSTFGSKGMVITDLGNFDDDLNALLIQPDNKILAGGFMWTDTTAEMLILRYNEDGAIDSSFGTNGKAMIRIDTSDQSINDMALTNDGKIMCVGHTTGKKHNFLLVRFNANGKPDSTFGVNGVLIIDSGSNYDILRAVAIQTDDKIVVTGNTAPDNFFSKIVTMRFNNDGTPDSTFNSNGLIREDSTYSDAEGKDVFLQQDQKIITVGFAGNYIFDHNSDFILFRYNPDGTRDTTFGINGMVTTAVSDSDDFAYAGALESGNRILAAGYSVDSTGEYFALVCYNSDGTLDQNFGTNGRVMTSFGNKNNQAKTMVLQPDGKIILAGTTNIGSGMDIALSRYLWISQSGIAINKIRNDKATVYPNPLKNEVIVQYILEKENSITISFIDMQGHTIKTFNQGRQTPGNYKIPLNISDLQKGDYILQIRGRSLNLGIMVRK